MLNNTTEIKILPLTGQLIYSHNEENNIVDLNQEKNSDSAHSKDYVTNIFNVAPSINRPT